ncbi:TetR/AcrR family transcriptional regulator [Amycolatopsis sp. GA6-003]|uniref:TetR/AcrR family transcriptional regulator n=1 Tax=Amycolatopsis sp. GA6-003 TaxID=2652444 RepID=UPI003917147B
MSANSHSTKAPSDSREAILDAAERLMMRNGYDKTSIARICRESGFPVGSLYHHFGSKSALLSQVMERVSHRFFASLPASPGSRSTVERELAEYWDAVTETIVGSLGYFTLYLELLKMSFEDPDLRTLMDARNRSSYESIAEELLPFARSAGVADPDEVAGRLGRVVMVHTLGAVMTSAGSADAIREEMAGIRQVVRDVIMSSGAGQPG